MISSFQIINILFFIFLFIIVICLGLYVWSLRSKINNTEKSSIENSKTIEESEEIENILNRISIIENREELEGKRGPVGYTGDQGPPGERGMKGEPGPPGRTLIVNMDDMFQGQDELTVFKKIYDTSLNDAEQIDIILSNYSTTNDRNIAIENLKDNQEKNAKDIFNITNLKKLKDEITLLCKEVFESYEKYITLFENLYHTKENTVESEQKDTASECRIALRSFQRKLEDFNVKLDLLTEKRKEFLLGDKVKVNDL